jgi:hypothetical protein
MRARELERRLRSAPIPDEREARERGWRVVRAAYRERRPSTAESSTPTRLAIALAVAAIVLAVVLTPAGAKVVDFVGDAVNVGAPHAQPTLTRLPGGGSLLVQSAAGPWVVNADGSKRFLGDYEDAGWSAGGQFVAVAAAHELKAVEPTATDAVHWTVSSARPVTHPSWSSSGVRVSYLSGSSLRVVRGDGVDDHLLSKHVARVTPEWRPQSTPLPANFQAYGPRTNVLAYVTTGGEVVVRDTDSGKILFLSATATRPQGLSWSSDGDLLTAFNRHGLVTYEVGRGEGHPVADGMPPGTSLQDAVFAPHGDRVAAITTSQGRSGTQSSLIVSRPGTDDFVTKRVFSGPGRFSDLAWSPDGDWILVGWPGADQWLFLNPTTGRVNPVDDIRAQFETGATSPIAPPRVAGWCCTPFGTNSR